VVVPVGPEVDLSRTFEARCVEGVAQRPDFEPPARLDAQRSNHLARRGELTGQGVAERQQVVDERVVGLLVERLEQRPDEQPEEAAVEPTVLDAGVVPFENWKPLASGKRSFGTWATE